MIPLWKSLIRLPVELPVELPADISPWCFIVCLHWQVSFSNFGAFGFPKCPYRSRGDPYEPKKVWAHYKTLIKKFELKD